jgi:hypothetical protein
MFGTLKFIIKEVLSRSVENNSQEVKGGSDTLEDIWNVIIGFP